MSDFKDFLLINNEYKTSSFSASKFFHGDKIIETLLGNLIRYYNDLLKETTNIIMNENSISQSMQNQDKKCRKYMKTYKKLNEEINELEAEKLWLLSLEKLKDQPFIKEMNN